jgi:heme oxygenase
VTGTHDALGRLYVLEGSTLGGTFIDRHLAGLPALGGVRLGAFSPYGAETGSMWRAFRRVVCERAVDRCDVRRVVAGARTTFGALAAWCEPARETSGLRGTA